MNFQCVEQLWFNTERPEPNYTINEMGAGHSFTEGAEFIGSGALLGADRKISTVDLGNNRYDVISQSEATGVTVTQHCAFFEGLRCLRQYNTVKCEKEYTLQGFSSALLNIPCDGDIPWNAEGRFIVHFCRNSWMLEGQWKTASLDELGICPVRDYSQWSPSRYFWRSEGSWSSGRFYPLIIIEDTCLNRTYFMEHEGGVTWELSLGKGSNGALRLEASNADIHHDCWMLRMKKGDSYSTTSALYGYVDGDFEEAVKVLTEVKRRTNLKRWANGVPPVCYNVFMGAIFGEPTDRNLIPLIDAAARAGCEVFCIDAGWYRPEMKPEFYGLLGDYVPDENRFGTGGLKDILEYIKSKNMLPGLWFEFEAVNAVTDGGHIENGMARRCGTVVSPNRGIFDLRNSQVREHLFKAVDRVYKMGMRYIKNDHNYSSGIGFGEHGERFNHEAREHADALCSFIDELYARYPDLIIENCGSGAQREDNGTLSHFHVQSTSDQEMYYNYPPIASGTLALMPPEKAGNWVYPYAVTDAENKKILTGEMNTDFLLERYADGEICAYTMVTGFFGCMFLSGRIDVADEKNAALIKEAVDLYKQKRRFIASAWGIFPMGFSYQGKKGFYATGLTDGKKILLGAWKTSANENTLTLDMSKYMNASSRAECIYPKDAAPCLKQNGAELTLTLEGADCMGRLIEIVL